MAAPAARPLPNILLIVADDLGWGDLGCYGAQQIRTPRIDRLAAQGLRFMDAHSASGVCNPSRYSLLSGTYLFHAKRKNDYSLYFHEGQVTLPSLLKTAGYRTAALGKWHNGFGRTDPDWSGELKPGPLEIGFDSFFGTPRTHNEPPQVYVDGHHIVGLDPADPIRIDRSKGPHGEMSGGAKARAARPDDQIDLLMSDKAVQFIASQTSAQPFFLYLAFAAPHVPINPAPQFRGRTAMGLYADFVEQLDECTGRVLDALDQHGFGANTLVLFTSDNGAMFHPEMRKVGHRPNASWNGQKTDAWEGGHRVPFIARWPGQIPAGAVRQTFFSQVDIMATLADVAGAELPPGASPDGQSEWQAFVRPAEAPSRRTEAVFIGTASLALREGDWVYLPKQGSGGMTAPEQKPKPWGQPYRLLGLTNSDVAADGTIKPGAPAEQFYNLRSDPLQATNIVRDHPDRVKAMRARLDEIRRPGRPTNTAAAIPAPVGVPAGALPGLSQTNGVLFLQGRRYRGVGANYFDLFRRVMRDPTNTTSLEGLRTLGNAGIPFVRFAFAYDAREWNQFFTNRTEFLRRLDLVVRTAESNHVGLIPSFLWQLTSFPELAGEHVDQWADPQSRTCQLLREAVSSIVARYRYSPALWAWEFGNEANLQVDLPNAAEHRRKGGTERDDLSSATMVAMLTEFAREVRRHDPHRLVLSGHSHPRASAWHNTREKSWKADTREQTLEILRRDNPAPLDTIGIHLYADNPVEKEVAAWAKTHREYLRQVRQLATDLRRPLFIGEFGLASKGDAAQTRELYFDLLTAMEEEKVDLAAFWVYDLPNQLTWNITVNNARAWMLEAAAQANRRWAASTPSDP